jgi:hypothetical protein
MGAGVFDSNASAARAAYRRRTGTSAFTHDADVRAGRAAALHPDLDTRRKPRRESRDVPGKEVATPVVFGIDVTGSMGAIAQYIIDDAHKLMKLINQGKVVTDPQLCAMAIGDATCDRAPVQIGEFEADDKLFEAQLAKIYREGGGGGQTKESYELFLWYGVHRMDTDAWDRRRQKGFFFIMGDEAPYPTVKREFLNHYFNAGVQGDIPIKTVARELQEKFHVYCLRPGGTAHFNDAKVKGAWLNILPAENVIDVENWEHIVPMIAGIISAVAGDPGDDLAVAMRDSGFDAAAVDFVTHAIVPMHGTAPRAATGTVAPPRALPGLFRRLF